jgi:hypothetical protein
MRAKGRAVLVDSITPEQAGPAVSAQFLQHKRKHHSHCTIIRMDIGGGRNEEVRRGPADDRACEGFQHPLTIFNK